MRPLMSCELPQCSHVLLGMDNYSPLGKFMISRIVSKRVSLGTRIQAVTCPGIRTIRSPGEIARGL